MAFYVKFFTIVLIALSAQFSAEGWADLFLSKAEAESALTSVIITVCGNEIIETGEVCDEGMANGTYATSTENRACNSTCSGWAPYCGDETAQTDYDEQCDGTDLNGQTCEGLGYTGGTLSCSLTCGFDSSGCTSEEEVIMMGGGGYAYIPPPSAGRIIFIGKAYPGSVVTLLKDARIVTTAAADEDANFQITLTGISAGHYVFSIYGADQNGQQSSLSNFPIEIEQGTITEISGIIIAPTISISKNEVKKGRKIRIFGQSFPNADVSILIESQMHRGKKSSMMAASGNDGLYSYNLHTSSFDYGTYGVKSQASVDGQLTGGISYLIDFIVSTRDIAKGEECLMADLNCDGKVDLVDFSVLAYWYHKPSPLTTVDFNSDEQVDLIEFSIMAYYWTG